MGFLDQIRLLDPTLKDLLEILIVAYIVYRALLLIQGNRALQVLVGIVVLVFTYAMAAIIGFTMITYLLRLVFTWGTLALIIIFAPELRSGLATHRLIHRARLFRGAETAVQTEEIVAAVERLSRSSRGAIIAIEREVELSEYVQAGSAMQAKVSADLVSTIFTPYSPLHDGAVIIRGDNIIGAGCILPLSQTAISDRSLGTRHRAAIGLSEETDALVIVVSEETSAISVAQRGQLQRNISLTQLREALGGRSARVTAEHAVAELRA